MHFSETVSYVFLGSAASSWSSSKSTFSLGFLSSSDRSPACVVSWTISVSIPLFSDASTEMLSFAMHSSSTVMSLLGGCSSSTWFSFSISSCGFDSVSFE